MSDFNHLIFVSFCQQKQGYMWGNIKQSDIIPMKKLAFESELQKVSVWDFGKTIKKVLWPDYFWKHVKYVMAITGSFNHAAVD